MNVKFKLIPYEKLKNYSFTDILHDLQNNLIIIIDAKLKPEEEAGIISKTMEKISDKFSGIEIGSLELENGETNLDKVKRLIIERITGKRRGMTIIGPAKLVRKIKKNPEELMLYM